MKAKGPLFSLIVFVFFLQTVLVSSVFAATRIMPLGDSITQGYASGELNENRQVSYRKALWDKLINAGYDVDFVGTLNSGSTLFADGDHEGHPGWTDDEIVNGRPVAEPGAGKLADWLAVYQPDIVLLHIGTNGLDPSPNDVSDILDVVDNYSPDAYVIVARIINWSTYNPMVTLFNDNVEDMAYSRAYNTNDPAYPDNIIFGPDVDLEDGAGIDYHLWPSGDMENNLHPHQDPSTGQAPGYEKMANVWFSALEEILPAADAGSDQSVDGGKTVMLDGSRSINPEFNPILSYHWTQTGGTATTLSNPTSVQPTFTAPDVGSGGDTLSFQLTVTYSDGALSSDSTGVNVNGHSSSSSSGCFIGTAAR